MRAKNDKMVSISQGKGAVLVEHCRKLRTPTANETFDAEFEKEINAREEGNVDASEKKDRRSEG